MNEPAQGETGRGRGGPDGNRHPRFAAAWPEPRAPYCLPGIDPGLQDDAFAYLIADLFRLQQACQMLTLLPGDEDDGVADMARALSLFFARDWRCHQEDFDTRLGGLLRQRLLIGDCLEPLLDEIARQHEDDRERYLPLFSDLLEVAESVQVDTERFSERRDWFVEALTRQMNVKRLCILPIARERLTAGDQQRLLRDMLSARTTLSK